MMTFPDHNTFNLTSECLETLIYPDQVYVPHIQHQKNLPDNSVQTEELQARGARSYWCPILDPGHNYLRGNAIL